MANADRWWLGLIGVSLLLAPAFAAEDGQGDVTDLAGRYVRPYEGSYFEGEPYRSEDVIEISPTRDTHARISLFLNFRNGHSCSLIGNARMIQGRLTYRESEPGSDGRRCIFSIWREGEHLRWSDGDNSCISSCGMRGSLASGSMDYRLRGPLGRHRAR